jgi:peptidoglycan/LPS O-acetylase OafA/YrhL
MDIKYRRDIDGLRGIAVGLVVLYHVFPKWCPGGFVGVDIFFVISGYLITSIIVMEANRGEFSLKNFYLRRIRRLYPALILVLISTILGGWLILLPDEFQSLGNHTIASLLYYNNFLLWTESGYFEQGSVYKPLLHLWSLAVEEQFYLLWPAALLAIVKLRKEVQPKVVVLVTTILLIMNETLLNRDPNAAYYFSVLRFWELTTGACLALNEISNAQTSNSRDSPPANNQTIVNSLFIIAAAALVYSLAYFDSNTRFPGFVALLPVMSTALLIYSGGRSRLCENLLGGRILVFLGLISYPLYLWHWPIISFVWISNEGLPSPTIKLVSIFLSVALAYITYQLVERPFKDRVSLLRSGKILLRSAIAVAFGALCLQFGLIAPRNSSEAAERIVKASRDLDFPEGLVKDSSGRFVSYVSGKDKSKSIFVFGDSHAQQYSPRLLLKDNYGVRFFTLQGCPPIPGILEEFAAPNCAPFVEDSISKIISSDIETVVLAACWNCYFIQQIAPQTEANPKVTKEFHYRAITETGPVSFRSGNGAEISLERLKALIILLREKNKKVMLVLDNPYNELLDPRNNISGNRMTGVRVTSPPEKVDSLQSELSLAHVLAKIGRDAGARIINPRDALCPTSSECLALDMGGEYIYADRNHIRSTWVRENASYIDTVFE